MYIVSARKKWYAAILQVYWSCVGKLTPYTPGFLLNRAANRKGETFFYRTYDWIGQGAGEKFAIKQ